MKNQPFLLVSLFFLIACGGNTNKPHDQKSPAIPEIEVDTVDLETEVTPHTETFSIRARFIEFHLGDAEHYLFEDESGKSWHFSGSESENFDFTDMLSEDESDESNQGWGSNKDLQGKWFDLTYIKREQPEYIDGPMIMADVIYDAVLVE